MRRTLPPGVAMRLVRAIIAVPLMLAFGVAGAATWLMPAPSLRRRCLRALRRLWARAILRMLRVRVRLSPLGLDLRTTALCTANHTGYLDIPVLLSVVPGVFIAREGMGWWPLLGQLAAIGDTVFINRRRRFNVGAVVEKIRHRLRAGTSVIFFPEATSSGGDGLLPFKSSLFEAARGEEAEGFPVRPLVLCYRIVGGTPLDRSNRDRVFWYGGMNLVPHLWGMLTAPGIDVDVKVLPERPLSGERREFAARLREEMLRELLAPLLSADSAGGRAETPASAERELHGDREPDQDCP